MNLVKGLKLLAINANSIIIDISQGPECGTEISTRGSDPFISYSVPTLVRFRNL